MEEYRKFIIDLAVKNDSRVFLNSDEDHAREVLVQLFQNAESVLRIFAASLCSPVPKSDEYITSLSDFIDRNGEVRILLNGFDAELAKSSNLFKRLAYYVALGKPIEVRKTTVRPYLISDKDQKEVHFTVGDEKSYRIETDIVKRTAECSFNNPLIAKTYISFFDNIFDKASSIDLTKLFK